MCVNVQWSQRLRMLMHPLRRLELVEPEQKLKVHQMTTTLGPIQLSKQPLLDYR